jgi:hypothetical protein
MKNLVEIKTLFFRDFCQITELLLITIKLKV